MRDYLNCHETDAKAYSELKQSLAERFHNDRETYIAKKSDFINDLLSKAKVWGELADRTM